MHAKEDVMRGAERVPATLQHVTQLPGGTQLAVGVVAAMLACVACGTSPTGPTSAPVAPGTAHVGAAADGGIAVAADNGQQNLTPANFQVRGWECRNSPLPGRVVCSPPNQGFPLVPPPADRPITYTLKVWEGIGCSLASQASCLSAGALILLHPDVYNGQQCESTGQPFSWRPVIGYYECLHTTGS
jgi:hypothetical protein